VFIGHDVLDELPAVCRDLHLGKSVLIVTGTKTRDVAGAKAADLLACEHEVAFFSAPPISPSSIREAEEASRGSDFLVAVGGGRVIDTAKIAAFNLDLPFISVPTAASHDGIASARASVPGVGDGSLEAEPPIAIIADTRIIAAAPHRLLASGCADIISNYTAILDWELSHRLRGEPVSEYAVALSRMTAELLVKDADTIKPHQEESAWTVTKALVSSGVAMSIAGSSRPASGGEHKFAHALERLEPGKTLHGEACGVGTIITMYLHGGDWRAIREALRTIGAPTTPTELGVGDDAAVEALMMAKTIRPERFTILDMGLSREQARELVKMLYQE
ncbi:MAG: NAD(P)-dependent glycerol-1-phosphate dehydrogenase, partial [Methanoregulaceae archaeon]|nr:NAD(P)-dependent glycerol-1-phosphate dehydrogenase [Methanoregulaceae archaeon]